MPLSSAQHPRIDSIWLRCLRCRTQRNQTRFSLGARRSAATLHGFPVWSEWLHATGGRDSPDTGQVQVIVDPTYRSSRSASLQYIRERVPPSDVVSAAGVRVTSPERTLIDLARSEPFEVALACADQHLRETVRVGVHVDVAS